MRMKTTMIGVLLLFSVAFARAENRPNHSPHNVVVILCDDLGYGELPVYRKLYKEARIFRRRSVLSPQISTSWQKMALSAPGLR